MNNVPLIAVVLLIIAVCITMVVNARKKRWEKVRMADGDIMCLYRTSTDYWFRDKKEMSTFHDVSGRYIKLSNRFTIKREEISGEEVSAVMQEIVNMRMKKELEEGN